jgi:hypothetical protein
VIGLEIDIFGLAIVGDCVSVDTLLGYTDDDLDDEDEDEDEDD